jgi:hypothetical protein
VIKIDRSAARVLEAWRERQLFERLEWGDGWTDSGRVFTREDGTPLRHRYASEYMRKVLIPRAGLPPVRFHDLRHGSTSMLLAAGVDLKVVSATMGHATAAFTADVYVTVLDELGEAAASAIEAFVPARPAGRWRDDLACHQCASTTRFDLGSGQPLPCPAAFVQVAEADGNRTRQRRGAPLAGFEDRSSAIPQPQVN